MGDNVRAILSGKYTCIYASLEYIIVGASISKGNQGGDFHSTSMKVT